MTAWYCATCGAEHGDLPLDWAFDAPAQWDGPQSASDRLSSDLCEWTDDDGQECYFIRGLLELPIIDSDSTFAYGAWSSLSRTSYLRILDLWDDPARVEESPYFGWFSNAIDEFPESLGLPVDVVTAALDLRPSFFLRDGDHPLVRAQREGVTVDFVREVAAKHLHAG